MTKFLTELITDKTPILLLEHSEIISDVEKYNVLGVKTSLSDKYIRNMYYYNNLWYYFKEDDNNYGFPFYIIDELVGSYMANLRGLATVSYQVAQINNKYGLASINFKQSELNYCTLNNLIDNPTLCTGTQNIDILKNFCNSLENEKEFLKHLFNLFTLDIHMLQKDRCSANLQFQMGKDGSFDIAPIYDYSNCALKVDSCGIVVKTPIILLNDLTIRSLLRKYPKFKEYLTLCLEYDMKTIFEQICIDYHFNHDCTAYEQISEYYLEKDKSQKVYIKQMLSDITK